jgi:hypothetical protein
MKPDESAGSFDGFLRRFSAASLKRGEEKAAQKDAKMTRLRLSLL